MTTPMMEAVDTMRKTVGSARRFIMTLAIMWLAKLEEDFAADGGFIPREAMLAKRASSKSLDKQRQRNSTP